MPTSSIRYLLVPLLCVIAAAVALVHHKIISGVWFHWEVLEHHEPWIVAVLLLGYGYVLACIVIRERH